MSQYQINNNLQSDAEDLVTELLRLAKQDVSGNFLQLSGGTLTGNLSMGENRITELADGINSHNAVTKQQMEAQDALKLSLTGGSMLGVLNMNNSDLMMRNTLSGDSNAITWKSTGADNNRILTIGNGNLVMYAQGGTFFALSSTEFYTNKRLNMNTNNIINVLAGTSGFHAVNLNQLNLKLNNTGGTLSGALNMTSNKIINLGTGTNDGDAVNKLQMDAAISNVTGTKESEGGRLVWASTASNQPKTINMTPASLFNGYNISFSILSKLIASQLSYSAALRYDLQIEVRDTDMNWTEIYDETFFGFPYFKGSNWIVNSAITTHRTVQALAINEVQFVLRIYTKDGTVLDNALADNIIEMRIDDVRTATIVEP